MYICKILFMKTYLLLAIVFFSACIAIKPEANLERLRKSDWRLTAIGERTVNFGDRAYLKFDDKENRINGRAVCNSFFSEYQITGNKISFSPIGSTKMYCEGSMDDEDQIIRGLQNTDRYEIRSDLLYLYGGDKLLLTFKP